MYPFKPSIVRVSISSRSAYFCTIRILKWQHKKNNKHHTLLSLESSKPHTDSRHHVRKIFREDGLGNIIIEHTARVQQTIFPVLRVVVVVVKVVLSRKRIREKFPSEPPSAKSSSTTKTTKTNTPNALRFFEETTEKTARKHLHHAGYRNHAVPNEGRFTRQRAGI
jgi:hypothetical protein|tara:strand:+ start:256 stop:753 length:498 start_codon:yes stop_codon:yes gene_type:complete